MAGVLWSLVGECSAYLAIPSMIGLKLNRGLILKVRLSLLLGRTLLSSV